MIVTIDGTAGSGKSSTARAVADRLGFRHLDSGAFYRALTFAALESRIPPEQWPRLDGDSLDAFGLECRAGNEGFRFFLRGRDITDDIRSGEVDSHVSLMARVPSVREWLLHQLRAAAREGDLVTDGRDMGTVVFPHADLKIFLTADPEVRARRRLAQRGEPDLSPERIRAEADRLLARDRLDSEREAAPLRVPGDAVVLDTSDLSFEEQVERVLALVRSR